MKWARKHGIDIPKLGFNYRTLGKGVDYVSNRFPPSDAEVMKVLKGSNDVYLNMMVFIGEKMG